MVLPRPSALRASSIARFARPARCIRSAERQPWQQLFQQRAYASAHGAAESTGASLKSDLPWAAGGLAFLSVGMYLVLNQDLSHGEAHGEHGDHHEKHAEAEEEEAPAEEEQEAEAKTEEKTEETEAPTEEKKEAEAPKVEKKETEEPKAEEKDDKSADPAKSDKPDARKNPKGPNETSGKQEGLSNADTKHSTDFAGNPDKSTKGEGVAETAKLKGTVSTNRPSADNKEQRGNTEQDKSQ